MADRVLNNIPWVFITGILSAYIVGFFILDSDSALTRFFIYTPYAAAVTALFGINFLLCRRNKNGKVPLLLATFTWTILCFAVTMWGVSILVFVIFLVPDWSEGWWIQRVSVALITGGMIGDLIAAIVLWIGFKKKKLRMQVHPWPRFSRKKDLQ